MPILPSPIELLNEMPLSVSHRHFIETSRETIIAILERRDPRLLLIVGPCSLHDEESTYEYADRLSKLIHEVKDSFFIVMRSYFEKPRTKIGWKGLVYDPDLDGSNNINKGLRLVRKILLNLVEKQIVLGAEILEFATSQYFSDLISWGCIGARTVMSQPHRQLASSFPFPMGFKNSVEGNIEHALNGIISANLSHSYIGIDQVGRLSQIKTEGNPHCHLVLRGGKVPNYDAISLAKALQLCEEFNVSGQILIDCSHDNSQKKELLQIKAFNAVLDQFLQGNQNILGMMLESHLHQGCQTIKSDMEFGISVTDPCLSWENTEKLIYEAAHKMTQNCIYI